MKFARLFTRDVCSGQDGFQGECGRDWRCVTAVLVWYFGPQMGPLVDDLPDRLPEAQTQFEQRVIFGLPDGMSVEDAISVVAQSGFEARLHPTFSASRRPQIAPSSSTTRRVPALRGCRRTVTIRWSLEGDRRQIALRPNDQVLIPRSVPTLFLPSLDGPTAEQSELASGPGNQVMISRDFSTLDLPKSYEWIGVPTLKDAYGTLTQTCG